MKTTGRGSSSSAFSAHLCWLLLVFSAPVKAHHSAAGFDVSQIVVIDGTVVEYELRSPHSYVTVEDHTGRIWQLETDATPILARSGWTRDTFEPGDSVSARVHSSKSADDGHVLLVSIQSPEGRVLDSYNRARRENDVDFSSASSLAGVWTSTRSDTLGFYLSYRDHPLTEKGRMAKAAFDPRSAGTAENCVPYPTPFLMTSNYWYLIEVEMADDRIVFRGEFYDAQRTVFMDGRQHPQDGPRTVQGHSIGWWEGETLVIDTTLFSPHPSPVSDTGIPSGTQKHVVERLTLSEDGSTVLFGLVVEDPEYLAEPVSAQLTWQYAPRLELISAPCNPDAAQRYLE